MWPFWTALIGLAAFMIGAGGLFLLSDTRDTDRIPALMILSVVLILGLMAFFGGIIGGFIKWAIGA